MTLTATPPGQLVGATDRRMGERAWETTRQIMAALGTTHEHHVEQGQQACVACRMTLIIYEVLAEVEAREWYRQVRRA